jgi:hypothetical protein
MECIAVLLYLLLRQAIDLFYEYKRAKLKEPPPPVNTTAIGFEIPDPQEFYDEVDKKPYK